MLCRLSPTSPPPFAPPLPPLPPFPPQIVYLQEHPALWWHLVLFGLCSGFGQLFIFHMIRSFDALTLSIVTTSRKFMTIVVNAIVFPAHNKMNFNQWGCVGVVFAAIALDSFGGGGGKHKAAGGKGGSADALTSALSGGPTSGGATGKAAGVASSGGRGRK